MIKVYRCAALYLEDGVVKRTSEVLYWGWIPSEVVEDCERDAIENGWPDHIEWVGLAMVQVVV